MDTDEGKRSTFIVIGAGPWLRDTTPLRQGKALLMGGMLTFLVAASLAQGMRQPGVVLGLIGCLSVLAAVTGGFMVLSAKATQGDWQWCAACLERMTAGAVTCPYCGKHA